MIYDIHSHVMIRESSKGNHLAPVSSLSFWLRRLHAEMKKTHPEINPEQQLLEWIGSCHCDQIVLLALDGCYREDGTPDDGNTKILISNDYIHSLKEKSQKILFGASIHPYRKDALSELERVQIMGACLIKWLPSAQNIDLNHKRCLSFYEALAERKIPLLVHTGVEHAIPTFSHRLNDPQKLTPALKCGVKVIAAHCGTRLFLHEKNYFRSWVQMARKYEHCYGDVSAFGLPLHGFPLSVIKKDSLLLSKVLYGSDFPAKTLPSWYLWDLGFQQVKKLRSIRNPLDRSLFTLKALGLPDQVFSRAENILSLKSKTIPPRNSP